MYLLHKNFSRLYSECRFFAIHDCFGTTIDKVSTLKVILASVYTHLYSNNHYLFVFDEYVFDNIKSVAGLTVDLDNRTVKLYGNRRYVIQDINWVLGNKPITKYAYKEIDDQHLVI